MFLSSSEKCRYLLPFNKHIEVYSMREVIQAPAKLFCGKMLHCTQSMHFNEFISRSFPSSSYVSLLSDWS